MSHADRMWVSGISGRGHENDRPQALWLAGGTLNQSFFTPCMIDGAYEDLGLRPAIL